MSATMLELRRASWETFRVAPATKELPLTTEIVGFTPEKQAFVKDLVQRIGMPLDRVSLISHEVNAKGTENTLGQANIQTGRLNFFKRMEGLPAHGNEISQVRVAAHELKHINTVFLNINADLYGGKDKMKEARETILTVAEQTIDSKKFLTNYHKWLYSEMEVGNITKETFVLETEAIMAELRIGDPKKLENILNLQNPNTAQDLLAQFDASMVTLMGFDNTNQLNYHVQALRDYYNPQNYKPKLI